jgi:hypothetical protein
LGRGWRLRTLEPHEIRRPRTGDDPALEDIDRLIFSAFSHRHVVMPDVATTLAEIAMTLEGWEVLRGIHLPLSEQSHLPSEFVQVLEDTIRRGVEWGTLCCEPIVDRPWASSPTVEDDAPSAILAAASPEEETWFSLTIVDEVGEPIDGVSVTFAAFGSRRTIVTDAAGLARLDGAGGSMATARLASPMAVREKLAPRWRTARTPQGQNVVVSTLDDVSELSLECERPTTLVLRPYFKCNEIVGVHFDFGRSFVRASAIEPLSQIAEILATMLGRTTVGVVTRVEA